MSLRVTGTVGELDAGLPLNAPAAAGPSRWAPGTQAVSTSAGPFSVDLLRLRSPAPSPRRPSRRGSCLSPGRLGADSVSGVRLELPGRAGWCSARAITPGGGRRVTAGGSVPHGSSTATPTAGTCPRAAARSTFTFAPQSTSTSASHLGGGAALLLLALAFTRPPKLSAGITSAPPRVPPGRADGAGRAAAGNRPRGPARLHVRLTLGALHRAGARVIFWRGVGPASARRGLRGLLAVAVPIVYVIAQPNNEGGYNFAYSVQVIYAHWVGVVAVILLGLSGWFTLTAARGRRAERTPPPLPGTPGVADGRRSA